MTCVCFLIGSSDSLTSYLPSIRKWEIIAQWSNKKIRYLPRRSMVWICSPRRTVLKRSVEKGGVIIRSQKTATSMMTAPPTRLMSPLRMVSTSGNSGISRPLSFIGLFLVYFASYQLSPELLSTLSGTAKSTACSMISGTNFSKTGISSSGHSKINSSCTCNNIFA
ncbi:hypothetical protein SDC9_114590 [bioreactor metagenome]|uniref:Uncharacterized protein n=1 Tax=bioreactor metagenome TaxID=1076179 RepID=A0A645BQL3_9ZZZZ